MITALNKNFGTISLEFYLLFELVIHQLRPVFPPAGIVPDPQRILVRPAAGSVTYVLCRIIGWFEKRAAEERILRSAK
jgi:hypothetical protein